jgi:hypothetical protein
VIADKNIGCKVNVHYVPPDDGHVNAETCVGVKGYKVKIWCVLLVCDL